jgi:GTP cyclohydrolase IA
MDRAAAEAAIEAFLRALGHPIEGHLKGTGARVASLYADELLDGYMLDPRALLADAMPAKSSPLVIVERLTTHVVCPHHLTIGRGYATVLYQPRDRVVGLGAIAQVVDACTHRLVLQEDAGDAVARALVEHLHARGAACVLTMRHGCLEHHGEKKRGAVVRTIAFAGSFLEDTSDRALALAALPPRKRRRR